MPDMEKVIRGLECCVLHNPEDYHKCNECPYRPEPGIITNVPCSNRMMWDAIALLKEQEPRVMTLDEIKDGEHYWLSTGKEFLARPVICVCREDDARKSYITFKWQFGEFSWEAENYGKTWICWTSRPSDAQQKAVKWE